MWNRLFDLVPGLDADEPLATRQAHGDVLHRAQHVPAVAVAQPAKLGQEYAAVALIDLDLFRIGVAEALGLALLFEAREIRPPGEEVGASPLQILERLLQRVDGRVGQSRGFRAVTPLGEQLAQPSVAELLLPTLVALLLLSQCLVEHKPARPGEAAHVALWSSSCFASSCGGAPKSIVRQYIEQQRTPH